MTLPAIHGAEKSPDKKEEEKKKKMKMKAEAEEESDSTGPKIPSYPNTCFLHDVVRGGTNARKVVALRKTKAEESELVQLDGEEQEKVLSPV